MPWVNYSANIKYNCKIKNFMWGCTYFFFKKTYTKNLNFWLLKKLKFFLITFKLTQRLVLVYELQGYELHWSHFCRQNFSRFSNDMEIWNSDLKFDPNWNFNLKF